MMHPEYNLRPLSPEQTLFGAGDVERLVSIPEIRVIAGWSEIDREHKESWGNQREFKINEYSKNKYLTAYNLLDRNFKLSYLVLIFLILNPSGKSSRFNYLKSKKGFKEVSKP